MAFRHILMRVNTLIYRKLFRCDTGNCPSLSLSGKTGHIPLNKEKKEKGKHDEKAVRIMNGGNYSGNTVHLPWYNGIKNTAAI